MRSWMGDALAFDLVVTIENRSLSRTAASRNALALGKRNRYWHCADLTALSLLTFLAMSF